MMTLKQDDVLFPFLSLRLWFFLGSLWRTKRNERGTISKLGNGRNGSTLVPKFKGTMRPLMPDQIVVMFVLPKQFSFYAPVQIHKGTMVTIILWSVTAFLRDCFFEQWKNEKEEERRRKKKNIMMQLFIGVLQPFQHHLVDLVDHEYLEDLVKHPGFVVLLWIKSFVFSLEKNVSLV